MFLPFAPGGWHDGFERVGRADTRPNLPMADFFMVSPEYLVPCAFPFAADATSRERTIPRARRRSWS